VLSDVATRTTVVVVAHRLSTVRAAARIVVLHDGMLRSIGGHDYLIHADELYASLAAGQGMS
jgi:ATP-binding cassette subfamily B protein